MASIHPTNSLAANLRSQNPPSILPDREVQWLCELLELSGTHNRIPRFPSDVIAADSDEPSAIHWREILHLSAERSALDLPALMDVHLGIRVWKVPLATSTGGIVQLDGAAHIFVSESLAASPWQSCARQFFMLLSRSQKAMPFSAFEAARFDNSSEQRTFRSKANKFALELLMPGQAFLDALRSIRRIASRTGSPDLGDIELIWLSRVFGTSFFATGKRAEDLGLLPKGSASAFTDFLNRNHGGPEARARELGIPPRPDSMFPRVCKTVLGSITERLARGEIRPIQVSSIMGSLLDAPQGAIH